MSADKLVLLGEAEEAFAGLVYELGSIGLRPFGAGDRGNTPGLWEITDPWRVHFEVPDQGVLALLTDVLRLVDEIGEDYKKERLTPPVLTVLLRWHAGGLAGTLSGIVATPTNIARLIHDIRRVTARMGLLPEDMEASPSWALAFSEYMKRYHED